MSALLPVFLVAAALISGPLRAAEITVTIANFTFTPQQVTVKPGDTVTWVNDDDIPHSVIESGHSFKSPPLDTGDKFSMSFTSAGESDYFCGFHPHMQGKVTVAP